MQCQQGIFHRTNVLLDYKTKTKALWGCPENNREFSKLAVSKENGTRQSVKSGVTAVMPMTSINVHDTFKAKGSNIAGGKRKDRLNYRHHLSIFLGGVNCKVGTLFNILQYFFHSAQNYLML